MKEYFQNVYKVWSAFSRSIRAIVLKNNEDILINTFYFGKFYVFKLDEFTNNK